MTIKYVFREDKILSIKASGKADPQKIGAALEAISAKSGGRLLPEAVVDAARDNKSPLHRHFEWDDKVAAESFRRDQARDLIQAIHVESTETDSGYSRAFLSIADRDGTAYRTIEEVLNNSDLQSKVLAAAERDLLAFERRYTDLQDICLMIRAAREQIAQRRSSVKSDRRIAS